MNNVQKEIIREKIKTEIEKTKRSIAENKDLLHPIEPDCAIGRVSRMDAIVNQNVAKIALQKAEDKLRKLELAQKNIDNQGFGICAKCGQDIPIGRILLVPQSKFCVKCASQNNWMTQLKDFVISTKVIALHQLAKLSKTLQNLFAVEMAQSRKGEVI